MKRYSKSLPSFDVSCGMFGDIELKKDEVFKEQSSKPTDFQFNTKVAEVFDDMVDRSVPFYSEIQRMIAELTADHHKNEGIVFDLGCSTGTTILHLDSIIPPDIHIVGVDESSEMLTKCEEKLKRSGTRRPIKLLQADLNKEIPISNACVAILCLTLQFIRPLNRERLLKQIYNGLQAEGALIVVEKILAEDSQFNREFIKYYYDMKRRHHYSEMEIAQKREALENILIPYKLSENITLLRDNGFQHCEVFFKWYNFAGIIAKKSV
ncbi:MAG: carboxy-S-adenosyl-L-methionine synthase CmoA [Chitinophagaceae bacterium]|nr:carboxy-S-adenosyl-L-methionine synthase CmoA [Chitinophagaceae bacterium]